MKKVLPYLFFVIFLGFLNCSSSDEGNTKTLTIHNNTSCDSGASQNISSVLLANYQFSNLSIAPGSSETFVLDQGLPNGTKSVRVELNISCGPHLSGSLSKSIDFSEETKANVQVVNCPQVNTGCCGNIICVE